MPVEQPGESRIGDHRRQTRRFRPCGEEGRFRFRKAQPFRHRVQPLRIRRHDGREPQQRIGLPAECLFGGNQRRDGVDAPFFAFRQNFAQHTRLAHPQQRPAGISGRQQLLHLRPDPLRRKRRQFRACLRAGAKAIRIGAP